MRFIVDSILIILMGFFSMLAVGAHDWLSKAAQDRLGEYVDAKMKEMGHGSKEDNDQS